MGSLQKLEADSINMAETPESKETLEQKLSKALSKLIGYTSAPSTNRVIEIDIAGVRAGDSTPQPLRVLGEMVLTMIDEAGKKVLTIGQVTEVRTENRWHSDFSFKGVIKQFGRIPHLTDDGDIRIAKVAVQSAFVIQDNEELMPHILGISPSTGKEITVLNNDAMQLLMKDYQTAITYIGKAYGADVDIPFWFKHFGLDKEDSEGNKEYGSGDAYHIGVFGKTGSGKTTLASMMLLGYAKNRNSMNILILDPQAQFYDDKNLLPPPLKFSHLMKERMEYATYNLVEEIYLSDSDIGTLPRLLRASRFIRIAFELTTEERQIEMAELIRSWMGAHIMQRRREVDPSFSISNCDIDELLRTMLSAFIDNEGALLKRIYADGGYFRKLQNTILERLSIMNGAASYGDNSFIALWRSVLGLYKKTEIRRLSINNIVDKIISQEEAGNCIVLNLSSRTTKIQNENLQALFINLIQGKIQNKAASIYERFEGDRTPVNALVVVDEAHRFASADPADPGMKELSKQIVDAVRTTRKYGVGYMFITQSLYSLNEEVISQMRIFGFGFGLTTGTELRHVGQIVNSKPAMDLYTSFIDPGSNKKYPFMFYGPVSPLSFTGAPIFIETHTDAQKLEQGLRGETSG